METKRKLIKLKCFNCGCVFNNYYSAKHERQHYGGKLINVQRFEAPKNPF